MLDRRALSRAFFALGVSAIAGGVLAACTAGGSSPGTAGGDTNRVPLAAGASGRLLPDELATIPQRFTAPSKQQGTLVELCYDTYESVTYEQKSQTLTKRAIVYLPYAYDAGERYDVFYLMHGGWSDETTWLGTPSRSSGFKNVLDNAIAVGEIRPLIVVCPTYNNTSPGDSGDFSLALTLTQNYHRELLNDLLPAVEGRYSTYAEDTSSGALIASRDHRGFGGFSMGAVTTWRTFQHGMDYFRYFLPMSCGTSLDMENILSSASGHDPTEYFIWIMTGTNDFAYSYDRDRVGLMRTSPYFTETGNGQEGNFAFRVKEGYSHDETAATEYAYNGLVWFWGAS